MLRVRCTNPVSEKLAHHREWFMSLYSIWDAFPNVNPETLEFVYSDGQ